MKKIHPNKIASHARRPRNFGKPARYTFTSGDANPSCGDKIVVYGDVQDGVIRSLHFEGEGCSISIASASLLTELCKGKKISDVVFWSKHEIADMLELELGITRLKCAMLPLCALKRGLEKYIKRKAPANEPEDRETCNRD